MSKDYIIAFGGTGARCLEACIYLAATGLFTRPIHTLMIDPDQNNGNSVRTGSLLPLYHQLHGFLQPKDARQRTVLPKRNGSHGQTLFQASLNLNEQGPAQPHPYFWQDPNNPDRTFGKAVSYSMLSSSFQDFVHLFYEQEDLDMRLGKGYRGRPNIGAVTLMSDLRRTTERPGNGLTEFIDAIRSDLRSDAELVRVFVFGSVFGGTGAAGLPTIPELLREIYEQSGHQEKLRFGCAMMTPYFSFPKGGASKDGPAPDPNVHQVATQAALLHYANEPPSYQHAYVIGAPDMLESSIGHKPGGGAQVNDPHYDEIIAGLAARDFFNLAAVRKDANELHYANGDHFGWDTLPSLETIKNDRLDIKQKLLAFTTFAYLLSRVLHDDLKDARWYSKQAWYRDNFIRKELSLDDQGHNLDTLSNFLESYLKWLDMIGHHIGKEPNPPFNWPAFALTGKGAERELGTLSSPESGELPKYADVGYGKIMERFHALRPGYSQTPHPVGLLIYLLYEAVSEFVTENYRLRPAV